MATPPTTFDRSFSFQEQGQGSHPSSRRNSGIQSIDSVSANANNLDMPYQAQSASWDTLDFNSARTTSPGFPYTPSYRDSFTPYGSDSGVSWAGRDTGPNQLFDEPTDANDVEYNPADFDGPGSHSNIPSPYFMDQELSNGRQGVSRDYMSSAAHESPMSQMLSNTDHLSPRMRSFSGDSKSGFGNSTHAKFGMDPNSYSPRPFSVPSPASSVGHLESERPRSRASSISSVHHQPPALTVGPMGEAFDKLAFDPVDSDLLWRNQQQQLNQQGTKAQSPPQLLIPNDGPSSSLQIPSFGNNHQGLGGTAGVSTGSLGLAAPSINILPSTPISGGASASNVPFQQVLQTLNERRQNSGSSEDSMGMITSHGTSQIFNSLHTAHSPIAFLRLICP